MEGAIDFQDWELLQGTETAVAVAVRPVEEEYKGPDATEELDSDDGIKKDYFSLDYDQRYGRRGVQAEEEEESLPDSDNPSWVDPETEPRFSADAKGKIGLELPYRGVDGLWTSEESSDDQKSPAQRSEKGLSVSDILSVGVGEVQQFRESFEMEYSTRSVGGSYNNESKMEGFGDSGVNEPYMVEETDGSDDISSAESVTNNDNGAESPQETETESKSSENQSTGIRQSSGMVWWKLPVEVLKFCVFKLRPVWSISIAAAFMGFVMLGRKLYKMNRRAKSIPFRVNIDDKKASQFALRAARLNEAFSGVRRVPIIKAPLPSNGIAPWPVLALR